MAQERNKGQAGMGGRGKNQERGRHDVGTRRRERKTGGGASLTKPSTKRRANQQRNQHEWHAERRMKSRY
jgi:hypothetical protein